MEMNKNLKIPHSINNTTANNSSPPHSINTFSSPPHSIHDRESLSPMTLDSPNFSDHLSYGFCSPIEEEKHQDSYHWPKHTPENSPDKNKTVPSPHLSPVFIPSLSVRDKPAVMTQVDSNSVNETPSVEHKDDRNGFDFGSGRTVGSTEPATKRTMMIKESTMSKLFLGFRISGMVLCLISFSVMVSDKNKGWALDSYDRYKELRYCMAVNVIGFVYSGAQAGVVTYDLATGNKNTRNKNTRNFFRYHFDFFMDQVLSYLLVSASSSAATRVEDWKSNWGKDKFPQLASVSVALSFLAFAALASSSLLSGYTLFTLRSNT